MLVCAPPWLQEERRRVQIERLALPPTHSPTQTHTPSSSVSRSFESLETSVTLTPRPRTPTHPPTHTATCSSAHLPGYKKNAGEFKKSGIDQIACLSVNDAFVMDAWGKDQGVADEVRLPRSLSLSLDNLYVEVSELVDPNARVCR